MGPLLVLFSPCFRENAVVTCKTGSFLCSSDNLLQKTVIVFFFENQISKWRSFEKRAIFDLLFTFFSYQGQVKLPSTHISLTYIHVFCSPILKKIRIYQVWFLFGMIPGFDSYSRHFRTIKTKWCAKFKLECILLICTYTNANFIVICKPRIRMTEVKTQLNTEIAKSTAS